MNILKIIAATDKIPGKDVPNIPQNTAVDILAGALNGAYFIAGVFAVIIIILAGFTFMTGSYDQAKITKAKNSILYAVVGLIVVILAFILTQFIIGKIRGAF